MRAGYISSVRPISCEACTVLRCLCYKKQAHERLQGQLIPVQIYPIHVAMPRVPVLGDQLPAVRQLFEMFQALEDVEARAGCVLAVHCTP